MASDRGVVFSTSLALAEALDATVVTCDGPFGAALGHSARIEVISPAPDGE